MSNIDEVANELFGEMRYSTAEEVADMKIKYKSMSSPYIPYIHASWDLWDDNTNTYKCSNCGELWTLNADTPEENNMNYCPKCGANMMGIENETN